MLFHRQLERVFRQAGLVPLNTERKDNVVSPEQNLLVNLAEDCGDELPAKRRLEEGGSLCATNDWERRWLGDRLILRPPIARFAQHVAYFSSRLGNKLDQQDAWFDALRTLCVRSPRREETLVACRQSTCGRFCLRAAQLFGQSYREVIVDDQNSVANWLKKTMRSEETNLIFVSPKLDSRFELETRIRDIPLADRVLTAVADRFVGLRIRKNGNIHRLFRLLCADNSNHATRLHLVVGEELVPPDVYSEFAERGVVGRFLWDPVTGENGSVAAGPNREHKARIIPLPSRRDWPYLAHWTRRAKHEWPDQDTDEFYDELILGCDTKDRSSLAALSRILQSQSILATVGSNRERTRTVSFTQVPLQDWAQHRIYRRHRNRWDFEPYGVCVSRKWLEAKGARAVIYGPDETRDRLHEADRPFFQLRNSKSAIDWTVEREWRIIGDVILDGIPQDQVFAFVATREEAERLALFSPFPLVVMGE